MNCNKCDKKGHYAKACRQKFNNNRTVTRLTEEEMNEPDESSCESDESILHIKQSRRSKKQINPTQQQSKETEREMNS